MDELAEACREGRLGDVERLLEDEESPLDPSKRDENGWCPLHYASQHGHLPVVEYLLRKGCDPSCRTTKDYATPLHLACANDRVYVALRLLQALPHGAPPRKTRDGSTPLHLACKVGNVQLVKAILERSRDGAYDLGNQQGMTPFGIAMSKVLASNSACDRAIANLLIERACGNPAREIRDFQRLFPAFNSRSSLERPIKVFAVGEPRSGKSTLFAALQSETATGQLRGYALRNVHGVNNHKVGVAPTDFTSRWMNSRVIFHDLASSRDFTHENLIRSADDLAMSVFIICVNLSEDRKEIRAKMHFWMSFVYDQCAEFSTERNKPSVAIVGSFSDVPRLLSLIPPQRLHLEYNDMVANDAFSGRFNLLRKYSMDCRKEGSLPLSQLRSALRRHFRKVRQGNENIPIRWYILSFVLETEFPVPAVTLGDLKAKICEGTGLLVLLPQTAEELLQLCQCLEQQERVVLVKPKHRSGIESTWIVHRSRQLLIHLDTALAGSPGSAELTGSPAVMTKNDLKESLSNAVRLLGFDVLVQVMEHFRICLPVTVEETTETERFYIPGLLPKEHEVPSWDPDATFCFSFAWALTPASPLEFFMPKFLKFLLLQLLTFVRSAEFESHSVWSGGICFSRHQGNMDICVMVNEKAVVLNVRCKQDHRIDCLTYRNKILEQIRDSKNKYQPQIQTKECVLPFEFTTRVTFPLEDIHNRRLTKIDVADLKKKLINGTDPRFEATLPFFEPYVCLRKLPERHRHALADPNSTHQLMSKEIMSALMKCFGRDIWKSLADNFLFPQESDSETDTGSTEGSGSSQELREEGGMVLKYGYCLDRLSSISVFEGASLSESLQDISTLTVTPESQHTGSSNTWDCKSSGMHLTPGFSSFEGLDTSGDDLSPVGSTPRSRSRRSTWSGASGGMLDTFHPRRFSLQSTFTVDTGFWSLDIEGFDGDELSSAGSPPRSRSRSSTWSGASGGMLDTLHPPDLQVATGLSEPPHIVLPPQPSRSTISDDTVGAHFGNLDTADSGVTGDLQTHSEDLHPRFQGVHFLSGSPWCDSVSSKAKKILWDEIGVFLDIPEGAVPPDKVLNLTVWPCIQGPFVPPPGYQFASPVFIIGPQFKFEKKLLLQLSHFIRLQSSDDCEKMVFLSARSTSHFTKDGKLGYHFNLLEGGSFEVGRPVGSINLSHFCALAAGKEIAAGGGECYSLQLHHSDEAMKAFCVVSIVHNVFSKNLEEFLEKKYPGATFECSIKQPVEFAGIAVTLHVPNPKDSMSGWMISSDITPCKIFKKEVDFPLLHPELTPDQIPDYPPKLPLTLQLEHSHPPQSSFLPCRLTVGGLTEPWNFMLLRKNRHSAPAATGGATSGEDPILGLSCIVPSVERLYGVFYDYVSVVQRDLISITDHLHGLVEKRDIYNLGIVLGLDRDRVKVIEQTAHSFLDDIIAAWLRREGDVNERGGPRWSTLVKALQHRRLRQLGIARDIAEEKGLQSLIEDISSN